jgi:hypothetical protein
VAVTNTPADLAGVFVIIDHVPGFLSNVRIYLRLCGKAVHHKTNHSQEYAKQPDEQGSDQPGRRRRKTKPAILCSEWDRADARSGAVLTSRAINPITEAAVMAIPMASRMIPMTRKIP